MAGPILQGQTVELKRGTLRGTPDCPVSGSVKGAKAVVVREPRRCEGPSGRIEDRVVVKPILGNGALGFPIEMPAGDVATSGSFLPRLADLPKRAARAIGRRFSRAGAASNAPARTDRPIRSRSYSQQGRDNWDRVFGRREKSGAED